MVISWPTSHSRPNIICFRPLKPISSLTDLVSHPEESHKCYLGRPKNYRGLIAYPGATYVSLILGLLSYYGAKALDSGAGTTQGNLGSHCIHNETIYSSCYPIIKPDSHTISHQATAGHRAKSDLPN